MSRFHRVLAVAATIAVLATPVHALTRPGSSATDSAHSPTWVERWLEPLISLFAGTMPGEEQPSDGSSGNETDAGPHHDPNGLVAGAAGELASKR